MARSYTHLTYEQRLEIKRLSEANHSKKKIAELLGVNVATVYREIDRGTLGGTYDPNYAERQYRANLQGKGKSSLLDENPELAEYIADLILHKKYSPEKIVTLLKAEKRFSKIPLSKQTIYYNIDNGKIPGVTRASLRKDTSRIFNNGQIIIPQWVLKELNLKDGDTLRFEILEDGKVLYSKAE